MVLVHDNDLAQLDEVDDSEDIVSGVYLVRQFY